MKNWKPSYRLLAIVLCVMLLIPTVAMIATAETASPRAVTLTGAGTQANPYVVDTLEELKAAMASTANNENYIRLSNSIELSGSLTLSETDKAMTLDLNGNTLDGDNYTLYLNKKASISNGALLCAVSSKVDLTMVEVTVAAAGIVLSASTGSKITVTDCKITAIDKNNMEYGLGVSLNPGVHAVLTNCTVEATGKGVAVSGGDATLTNCTISAGTGAGLSVESNGEHYPATVHAGVCTITSEEFSAVRVISGTVTVTVATLTGGAAAYDVEAEGSLTLDGEVVTGACAETTYFTSTTPAGPTYTGTGTQDDPYAVDTEEELNAALALSETAGTTVYIRLDADIVLTNILWIKGNVVLDLNGSIVDGGTNCSVMAEGTATVKNGAITANNMTQAIGVQAGGNLTLEDLMVVNYDATAIFCVGGDNTLAVKDCNVQSYSAHGIVINGTGTVTDTTATGGVYGLSVGSTATATVDSVKLTGYTNAYSVSEGGSLILDGKSVTGTYATTNYTTVTYTGSGTQDDPYVVDTDSKLRDVLTLAKTAEKTVYIKLDADMSGYVQLKGDVVLDLNGHTIDCGVSAVVAEGTATVKNGTVTGTAVCPLVYSQNGGNLTLENITVENTKDNSFSDGAGCASDSVLTIRNSTIHAGGNYALVIRGTATVEDVTLTSGTAAYNVEGSLTLDGEVVTGTYDKTTYTSPEEVTPETIEQLKKDLEDAKKALQEAIDGKASAEDLTNAITALTEAYEKADDVLKTLLQQEIDDDVAALKADLEKQMSDSVAALDTAIKALEKKLNDAVSELETALGDKASAADLAKAIEDLAAAYKAADEAQKAIIDASIEDLKMDLDKQLHDAVTELEAALAALDSELNEAVEKLDQALDNQVSQEELLKAVEDLAAAYKAADEAQKAIIDADIEALKAALEQQLKDAVKAVNDAITALETKLDEAIAELENAINEKVSAEELAQAIKAVTEAYQAADKALELAMQAGLDELKAALEQQLNDAVKALEASIAALDEELAEAIKALQEAIDTKASAEDLAAAVKALTEAYTAADEALKILLQAEIDADVAALKENIEKQLDDAVKALEASIAALEEALKQAQKELQEAIDTKASTEELAAAVKNLTDAYKAADEALKILLQKEIDDDVAALKADLEKQMSDARDALQAAIDAVQKNLDDVKAQLEASIVAGDKELADKIAALDEAYKLADDALKILLQKEIDDDVAALKKALEAQLDAAKKSLQAGIDTVQRNLDDAKTALEEAIAKGDKDLSDEMAALKQAMEEADALAGSNIADLDEAYKAADFALQAAIDELEKRQDESEKRIGELSEKLDALTVILVVACVMILGCIVAIVIVGVKKNKAV